MVCVTSGARVREQQAFTVVTRPSTNGASLARGLLLFNNRVRITNTMGDGGVGGATASS